MKKIIPIVNPVYIYAFIWTIVLVLFSLKFSNLLLDLKFKILIYIGFSVLMLLAPSIISISYVKNTRKNIIHISSLKSKQVKIVIIFLIVSVFAETMYFGLFPVFRLFGFSAKLYTQWGFVGFHGVINGIIMAYSISNFAVFLKTKNKRYVANVLLSILWPILMMSRGILMSIVVQLFFVYYYLVGIKYKYLNRLLLIFITIIILFGVWGDLRTIGAGSANFFDLAQPSKNYPRFLPSGFIWVYIYITTPLNNIVNNIDQYPLLQFSVFDAFGSLIPGNIRSLFGKSKDTQFKLVVPYLNVTSSHKTYLAGFGLIGSLLFQSLLGLIVTLFYIRYRNTADTKNCLIITILAHNLFLSFFSEFFLMLPYLSEFFFMYLFFTKITIK